MNCHIPSAFAGERASGLAPDSSMNRYAISTGSPCSLATDFTMGRCSSARPRYFFIVSRDSYAYCRTKRRTRGPLSSMGMEGYLFSFGAGAAVFEDPPLNAEAREPARGIFSTMGCLTKAEFDPQPVVRIARASTDRHNRIATLPDQRRTAVLVSAKTGFTDPSPSRKWKKLNNTASWRRSSYHTSRSCQRESAFQQAKCGSDFLSRIEDRKSVV